MSDRSRLLVVLVRRIERCRDVESEFSRYQFSNTSLSLELLSSLEAKSQVEILVFCQFVKDNQHEAISILCVRTCAAGLRYGQVKELARRLSVKRFHIDGLSQKVTCQLPKGVTLITDLSIEWRLGA